MKNFTTRFISIMLVIIAVIGIMPISAFASTTAIPEALKAYLADAGNTVDFYDIYYKGAEFVDGYDLIVSTSNEMTLAYNEYGYRTKYVVYGEKSDVNTVVNAINANVDVPILILSNGKDGTEIGTIYWTNGIGNYQVGDINIPGDYDWGAEHPEQAEDAQANTAMMKTRKESQAKFEAEVIASKDDINKATKERNWKGYINATNLATMYGRDGMDGTDYIVRLYDESTGRNIEVLNGQYCRGRRPMNIDTVYEEFPELITMPSIYPNGAYCKRVFVIPDMDITPFYEAWIIKKMNNYLANGKLPTCMPVLVISSNNWTKGGTVVWNNGFVDPSGKYVIESVGSHYSPYENKFSFTDSFGLPALYPKINDVGETKGYGWTMEEIRQAQIAAGIIPDDTKPETPDTDIVFTDVDSSAYYAEAVNWAAKNGITTGVGSNKFDPNGVVTRAQAVTFLYRAAGSPSVITTSNDFTDVPTGEWYSAPVAWAVANGITNGVGNNKFNPNDPVTYAQMLAFIARSVKATLPADMAWDDAPMAWARSANMFAGMPHSPIKGDTCPRADVVHFLHQYYK